MVAIFVLVSLVGAWWAASVARSKNNNALAYGIVGAMFPMIGVIAAYVALPTRQRPWTTRAPARGAGGRS